MRRARKVRVILPGSVAAQAPFVHLLRGRRLEAEDLALIPAAVYVLPARAVARFAALFRRPAARV